MSACLLLNALAMHQLLDSTFEHYEDEDVTRNSARVLQAIRSTYADLGRTSKDWSNWTETHLFLKGENDTFELENLTPGTLVNVGVNLLVFVDSNHEIKWSRMVSLESGAQIPIDKTLISDLLLMDEPRDEGTAIPGRKGIVATPRGLVFICARPVVRNDGSGVPSGTLMMGLFLDERWLRDTARNIQVDFRAYDLHDARIPKEVRVSSGSDSRMSVTPRVVKTDDNVYEYLLVDGPENVPVLLVEVTTPRHILEQRRQVYILAAVSLGMAGIIIMLVLTLALRYLVVHPLQGLTDHFKVIKKTGKRRNINHAYADDEIGALARQFDSLMTSQKAAEDRLRLLASVMERSHRPIAIMDADGVIQFANEKFSTHAARLECSPTDLDLQCLFEAEGQTDSEFECMREKIRSGESWSAQLVWTDDAGVLHEESQLVSPITGENGRLSNITVFYQDLTELNAMEKRLSQAQKLESVGQLAAGIAHEINTPIQFVGDNTRFVKDSVTDLDELLVQLVQLAESEQPSIATDTIRTALKKADVEFLREEMPTAIDQSLEGIERIAKIVRAMKEFSHPAANQSEVDLNRAIESTVTVASNEWKYVAEMKLDLASDLPSVHCNAGQINQVLLNIIVNAAHALEEAGADKSDAGRLIRIETSHSDSWVEIRISDNGPGIPDNVKARVFDPFFTTKEVGKGTGQGLNIAYDVVVNKHGGSIVVESEPGQGACFVIQLPVGNGEDVTDSVAAV